MKKLKKMTTEEKETLKDMINDECPCDTCIINKWSCFGCPKETSYVERQKTYMTKINLADTIVADKLIIIRILYNKIEKLKAEIDKVETEIKKHKKTIKKNFDITNKEIDELING